MVIEVSDDDDDDDDDGDGDGDDDAGNRTAINPIYVPYGLASLRCIHVLK